MFNGNNYHIFTSWQSRSIAEDPRAKQSHLIGLKPRGDGSYDLRLIFCHFMAYGWLPPTEITVHFFYD